MELLLLRKALIGCTSDELLAAVPGVYRKNSGFSAAVIDGKPESDPSAMAHITPRHFYKDDNHEFLMNSLDRVMNIWMTNRPDEDKVSKWLTDEFIPGELALKACTLQSQGQVIARVEWHPNRRIAEFTMHGVTVRQGADGRVESVQR